MSNHFSNYHKTQAINCFLSVSYVHDRYLELSEKNDNATTFVLPFDDKSRSGTFCFQLRYRSG